MKARLQAYGFAVMVLVLSGCTHDPLGPAGNGSIEGDDNEGEARVDDSCVYLSAPAGFRVPGPEGCEEQPDTSRI